MKRQTPAGENVSDPHGRVGIARLAQHMTHSDRNLVAEFGHDDKDALPDLTDAWFEEMIRKVDEASARLRRS